MTIQRTLFVSLICKADFKKLYFFTADYPYINYYVINKPREEAGQFYTANKAGQPRIRQLNTSESVSSSNVNLSAKLIWISQLNLQYVNLSAKLLWISQLNLQYVNLSAKLIWISLLNLQYAKPVWIRQFKMSEPFAKPAWISPLNMTEPFSKPVWIRPLNVPPNQHGRVHIWLTLFSHFWALISGNHG